MRREMGVGGLLVLGLALLACGAVLAEDIQFEQTVQMTVAAGQPPIAMSQKIWVSSGKTCMEMSGGMMPGKTKMIMRADVKKMYTINEAQRTYMEMPLGQLSGMANPMIEQMQFDVQKTGNTKKVNQWNCEEYVVTATGAMPMKMSMWVTKDITYDKQVMKEMEESVGGSPALKALAEKTKDIEGFPVEQTMEMTMAGQTITTKTTVTSVQQGPIPASVFEVPEGYTKAAMPAMPGGAAPGAPAPAPQQ